MFFSHFINSHQGSSYPNHVFPKRTVGDQRQNRHGATSTFSKHLLQKLAGLMKMYENYHQFYCNFMFFVQHITLHFLKQVANIDKVLAYLMSDAVRSKQGCITLNL